MKSALERRLYYIYSMMTIVVLAMSFGCAERREGPSGYHPRIVPAAVFPTLQQPVIRIGLITDARTVMLSGNSNVNFRSSAQNAAVPGAITLRLSFTPEVSSKVSVQTASFSSRENALRAEQNLKSKISHPVYIFENPDLKLFQLRVGPFSSKEKAQQAIQELGGIGYPNAFYVTDQSLSGSQLPDLLVMDENGNEVLRSKNRVDFWGDDLRIKIDANEYRGYASAFVNHTGRITVVNLLYFEDYLRGVIPNEIGPANVSTFEAIKAQAVAARTYAYRNRGQFESEGYDLCATPRCQAYSGIKTENDMASRAAEDTRGEILTYAGEPINALYTSTCGGRTENAEYMFEGWNYPYLKSVACYPEESAQRNSSAVQLSGEAEPWWLAWIELKLTKTYSGQQDTNIEISEAASATADLLRYLGKTPCSSDMLQSTNWIGMGEYLVNQLCWRQKRDSLLNAKDYGYFLQHLTFSLDPQPETYSFLFLFHDGILLPEDLSHFNPYSPMKRSDFFQSLHRILEHYHQINPSDGQIREINQGTIQIVDDTGVHALALDSRVFLYQKIGDHVAPKQQLVCAPGDQVDYALKENNVVLLVCEVNQAGAAADRGSKYSFWQETVSASELGERVDKYLHVGKVLDLQPLSYGVSGRVYEMKITGTAASGVLKGIRVRWALGVKDNLFVIDKRYDSNGEVKEFVFTGRGWGHGLGMCQTGALGYAKSGFDYRTILTHYYTGVQLTREY
jgi:stage II sporulation protein D